MFRRHHLLIDSDEQGLKRFLLGPVRHEVGLVRIGFAMLKTANDALVSPKNHAYLVGIVKCAVLAIQAMNHGLSGYGFLGVLENLENEIGTFASLTGSRKVVALLGTELLVAQFAIPSRLDISTATLAGGDDDWKVIEMTGVLVVARIVFFIPQVFGLILLV